MLFYQPTKNCAQTFTRSTQSLVKYAEKPLFQNRIGKNTVLLAGRKYTAYRKQKASENAAEWTVRSLKMLINQGFSELKQSDSSIYIRYLKFSVLTVHTKIERRKTSELQTKNRGCGNAVIHTDEQNTVHRRQSYSAGRQCHRIPSVKCPFLS